MGILFTNFGTLREIVVEGNSQLALSSFDGPMNKRCPGLHLLIVWRSATLHCFLRKPRNCATGFSHFDLLLTFDSHQGRPQRIVGSIMNGKPEVTANRPQNF
jgi:hypothetical protein